MTAPLDLVVHDWRNLAPEERAQAIADVHALARSVSPEAGPIGARHRRARALNILASLAHFLAPEAGGPT